MITTGTDVTEYVWEGDRLIREVNPDRTITFLYDGGELAGFSTGGSNYYYAKDSFGVISYVYNEDGSLYASYKYDAWGSLITAASTLPSGGDINPIRYKSYYYDADTGFYYLQSRYYDPMVGRFLNADDPSYLGISGTVLGWNMFAYCENDAVMLDDFNGCDAIYAVSFDKLPVVGHAFFYYECDGIWYKTQFANEDKSSIYFAVISSVFAICNSLYWSVRGHVWKSLRSLSHVTDTFAFVFNESLGDKEKCIADIKGQKKSFFVVLRGDYSYVYGLITKLNKEQNKHIHYYNLFKHNCAHYIEYLLSYSPEAAVRFVVAAHQITPVRLYADLQARQILYFGFLLSQLWGHRGYTV